eukprot:785685-Amphidinium_carterae.1
MFSYFRWSFAHLVVPCGGHSTKLPRSWNKIYPQIKQGTFCLSTLEAAQKPEYFTRGSKRALGTTFITDQEGPN